MAVDIIAVVVGTALVALSRVIADNFKIPGQHEGLAGGMIRLGGLGDDYPSQLYRWVTCVVTGLLFIAVGLAGLVDL